MPTTQSDSLQNVLLLVGSLRTGGTERQVALLANALVRRGVSVTVGLLSPRRGEEYALDSQILVLRPNREGLPALLRNLVSLKHATRAADFSYSFLDVANLVAWVLRPQRLIWGVRDSGTPAGTKSTLLFKLCALLSSSVDLMIANAESCLEHYRNHGFRPKEVCLIPNAVDVDLFRPDEKSREAWRRKLGISSDEVVVGMVARADPKKRHDLAIPAIATAGLRGVYVGRGVSQSFVDGFAMPGQVAPVALAEQQNLEGLTSAFDIALCVSDFEGFPNSIAEAMACGVPCVVVDRGDLAQIVGAAGVVASDQTVDAIARALAALAEDFDRRAECGRCARVIAVERFSIEQLLTRTLTAIIPSTIQAG